MARGEVTAAICLAVVLSVVSAVTIPLASLPGPAFPDLWPAIVSVESFAEFLTALIFYNRYLISDSPQFAFFSAAFIWSGIIKVGYVLSFPGILSPGGAFGEPSVSGWYFALWHGGFAALLAGGVLVVRHGPLGRAVRRTVACISTIGTVVCACIAMVAFGLLAPVLPHLISGNQYIGPVGAGTPVAVVFFSACVWIFITKMRRTTTNIFLALALLATALDMIVTVVSGSRFSLGWYVARIDSLVASGIVLTVLVGNSLALTAQLAARSEALSQLAYHDSLTGIANKRAFDSALSREWDRACRERRSLALLMCDVDFFKGYNDSLGHLAGDRALREVADIMELQAWRPGDIAARFGGEEFVMLLAETNEEGAVRVAERLREAIAQRKIPYPDSPSGVVTMSIGVAAVVPDPAMKSSTLVQMADTALYKAKGDGRNRVARHVGGPAMAADCNL